MRYVLIDKITELEPGRTLRGVKNVAFSDGLSGVFGENWLALPAAFVLEAMAQAAGLLVAATTEYAAQPVLAKVQQMRIFGRAAAGDQIEASAHLEDLSDAGARVYVHARIGTVPLATATVFLALVAIDDFAEGESAAQQRGELRGRLNDLFPGWFENSHKAEAAS